VAVVRGTCDRQQHEAVFIGRGVRCAIAFMRQSGQKQLPPLLANVRWLIPPMRALVENLFAWTLA